MTFAVGQTLQQRYQIQGILGRGGMGVVYKAYDPVLQRTVAIKVLPAPLTVDAEFVTRFQREAIASANLRHPHIVTVHDVGQQDGEYFIIMEYLEGDTLEQWLAQHGPMPVAQASQVLDQIAGALDHAHGRGIIHRDIKPSNIMLDVQGRAVLMDFGLVRAGEGLGPTRSTSVMGTPEYMAPEQVLGQTIDRRTDIYALGVVLYELLSGRTPFSRTTPMATAYAHVHEAPPPVSSVNKAIPKSIEAVLLKTLTKDPAARYQNAGDLARDFAQAIGGVMPAGLAAQPAPAGGSKKSSSSAAGSAGTVAVQPPVGAAPTRQRRSKTGLTAALGALVLVAVLLAVVLWPRPAAIGDPTPTPVLATIVAASATPTASVSESTASPLPVTTPTAPVIERAVVASRAGTALPPALPAPDATAIFIWQPVASVDEDFAQPSVDWPVIQNNISQWRVQDGAYRLTIEQPGNMVWLERGLDLGDFALTIEAHSANEDANDLHLGVLFRSSGADNFYRLDFAPGLGVELSKRVGGSDSVLVERVADRPSSPGAVRLDIEASGPSIQVWVDGQPMNPVNDASLARGDLAIYGVSGSQVSAEFAFDRFILKPLASEAVPVVLVPYKDPSGDFGLHVPEDWPAGPDALGVSFEAPSRLARVIVFPVADVTPDETAVSVARKALAQAQSIYPDFRIGQGTARQLAGVPAFEQSLTGRVLGVDVTAKLIALNRAGRGYAIVHVAQAAVAEPLQPLLAFVVDTFRFSTEPDSTATPVTPSPAATATPSPPATTGDSAQTAPQSTPVPAQPGVILSFETFGVWERGDEPYGALTQTNERQHDGVYAAKLTYDMPAVTNNYVVFLRKPPLAIPGQPEALNISVYGNGSGHFLNAWIQDSQGEVRQFTFGQVQHSDRWQQMTLALDVTAKWPQGHISGPDNGALDYPIKLFALVYDAAPDGVASKGTIYLDDLATGAGAAAQPADRPQTGTVEAQSTPAAPVDPAPLSGHIVFTSDNNVVALDVAAGNMWPVFRNGRQPDIRGDGRVVVNGAGGGKENLFTINLNGSGEVMTGRYPEDSYPHWSPSGVSTVFHSTLQGDGRERIYIQTDMTHSEEPKLLKVGNVDVYGRHATWLQNWRIAFTGCDYWASGSNCGIWTMDTNGGSPAQLTKRSDDRSTDSHGDTLLFSSRATGNWDVYAIPVNGGSARNLTNSPSHDVGAAFSSDGGSIAFMSDRDGSWGIWVMNADGSNPRRLLRVANGFGADWENERLGWR